MTFGEKLKQLREQAGLTQTALAEASGRSLGAVRDYEQGNRSPTLRAAFQLAAALGVSVEVFAECMGDEAPGSDHRTAGGEESDTSKGRRGRPPKAKPAPQGESSPRGPKRRP